MKSFKQYIIEQTEKSSYPWTRQRHGGWWHPTEPHKTWNWMGDDEDDVYHVSHIVRSPDSFGLSHDHIQRIITGDDKLNKIWREHYGWNDDQLKKKIAGGIIDNYPPIENAAHENGWVGVRRAPKLALRGYEPGLRQATDLASLHIPPSKLETEEFHLYDASKDKHFYLTGMDQIQRYIKKGIIPS
jgi:hypothetical protein